MSAQGCDHDEVCDPPVAKSKYKPTHRGRSHIVVRAESIKALDEAYARTSSHRTLGVRVFLAELRKSGAL